MNSKVNSSTSKQLDTVKLVLAVLALILGIAGFHFFETQPTYLRLGVLLGSVVVGVALVYFTELGRSLFNFFQDAKTEMRKVVWPTRAETIHTTLIVFVVVLLAALVLWLLDTLFAAGAAFIFKS
jgi:preprotein translocase subunit SecE